LSANISETDEDNDII